MIEHLAVWMWLLVDVIDPAGGISAEDVLWVCGAVGIVFGIIAAFDRRVEARIKAHLDPIKEDQAALRTNQAQLMRREGVEPIIPPRDEGTP